MNQSKIIKGAGITIAVVGLIVIAFNVGASVAKKQADEQQRRDKENSKRPEKGFNAPVEETVHTHKTFIERMRERQQERENNKIAQNIDSFLKSDNSNKDGKTEE